jgi:translocation and assembly module TamA
MLRFLTVILALCLTGPAGVEAAPSVKVDVDGLSRMQRTNVLAFLTIEQQRKADDLTEQRVRRYHQRAPDEIRLAMQPYGYYNPVILPSLEQDGDRWHARYEIDPGEPTLITRLDVRIEGAGEQEPAILKAVGNLPVEIGMQLVHAEYERARQLLRTVALDSGYRQARYLQHEVRVIQARNEAEITLVLDTGEKAFFGPVTFTGGNIREDRLERYVPFEEGDVWSTQQLLAMQRWLVGSGYFSSVDIVPQPEAAVDNRVPVTVNLVPNKLQRYSFGLGFSTNFGIQGSVNWLHRRINQLGHRLGAEVSVSQVRQDISTTYSIPLAKPYTDVLEFSAIYRNEETSDVNSEITELRASHNFQRGDWREVLSLGYKHEVDDLADGAGVSNLLIPKATWTLVRADNRLHAGDGYRIDLETSGSAEAVLSDATFLQGIVRGKFVHSLGENGRLIMRGDIGATATSDFESLPASNRFFTGGDNTVRGYEYKSLGPLNEDGELIGGKYLLVGSAEYDYNVFGNWFVAAFYDAGNAYNDTPDSIYSGAGVGIRWASPVGMVRVDIANALSEDDRPWRLHITFGPDF